MEKKFLYYFRKSYIAENNEDMRMTKVHISEIDEITCITRQQNCASQLQDTVEILPPVT